MGGGFEAGDLAAEELVFGGGLLEALALVAEGIDAVGERLELRFTIGDLPVALGEVGVGVGEIGGGGLGALGACLLLGER